MSTTSKLRELGEMEGLDLDEMLEEASFDSVAAGICTTEDCDYTTKVEPDCRAGWCEFCQKGTVQSCLVLAGLI